MKALILAAGFGSRLKDLTGEKPKALVPVNGRPILDYQLEALRQNNILDVVLVVGYQANVLRHYLQGRYSDFKFTFDI